MRFITNYTLTPWGKLINHITTIDDAGCLSEMIPLCNELANTRYVDRPVCLCHRADWPRVQAAIAQCASADELTAVMTQLRSHETLASLLHQPVVAAAIDFASKRVEVLTPREIDKKQ